MGYGQYSYNSFNPRTIADFRSFRDGAYTRNPDGTIGKRVKAVFDTSQVIHIWAQRSQTFGKNGKGNVYFEGDTLFDYGEHFALGMFVENENGETACFLNSDSYGPTTANHQGQAGRAVPPGIKTFTIPGAGREKYGSKKTYAEIIESYKKRATDLAAKAKRARENKSFYQSQAADIVEEAQEFAAFFGLPMPSFDLDALVAEAKVARAALLAKEKAAAEAARIESKDRFEAWQKGISDYCPHEWQLDENGGTRMRIKGAELETARGASVPLAHAVKVFRFLKHCKERGEAWAKNGTTIRVGHFTVDSIEPNGNFRAGCHYFTWAQVEAAAKAAKVFDLPAADTREKTGH